MLILLIDISERPGGPDESFVEFLHVLNVGLLFWFQKEKVIAHTKIRAKLPIFVDVSSQLSMTGPA